MREQVKLLQWRKGNWDNEYCIEFPCLMKSTQEHYGLLQILQARLFHSARWSGWLLVPQCSTIMVKFYEKLWLLKKITNYCHLKFFLLIAPKRGWHLCILVSDSLISKKSSPLKPLSQMNWNLVGSIYGRSSIKIGHFVPIR